MNLLEQLTLAGQALRHTLPQLVRPRLWAWALPLAAVELAVVALLWHAAHPAFSWFMAPLLVGLGGADTLHYPRIFELMPGMVMRADAILGAIVGSVVIGAATQLFAARFRGQPVEPGFALREAFRRAPALIAVLLPFNLALFLVDFAVRGVLAPRAGGIGALAAPYAVAALSLLLQAAFFYAAALVILEGRGPRRAWRELPATWRHGFLAALLVGAVTFLLLVPVHLPGVTPALLVERGRPELAGWLAVLQIVAGLLNVFILTGAATLLYLSAVRPEMARA
jgi:hypothetical protein